MLKTLVKVFLEIYKSDAYFGEVTNIGMNSEIAIGELAKESMKIMDLELPIVTDQWRIRPNKSEVERLVCNNKKIG